MVKKSPVFSSSDLLKDVHVRPIAALNVKEKSAHLRTRVDLRRWSRRKFMVGVESLLTSKCLQLAMACPFQDVRDQNKSSGADEATSIDVCDPSFLLGENTTVHSFEALGALDGTHNMAILMISRVAEVDLQSCVCPSMRSCKNRQTTGITRKLHLNFPKPNILYRCSLFLPSTLNFQL